MAQSIIRHLQVLIEPCNQLSNGEVTECTELLRKILFAIRFVWERCPYYQDDNHLSALLKKVSDLVIVLGALAGSGYHHYLAGRICHNDVADFAVLSGIRHGRTAKFRNFQQG